MIWSLVDGKRRILLLGHADTVYPRGTAVLRPVTAVGDKLIGPGTCDMKAGLLTGLYALRALAHVGWRDYETITFVVVSDEEIEERHSVELLQTEGPRHHAVITLEAARENGDIVSARKGVSDYVIEVSGRAAHAGVEPDRGRSAILEAAHKTVALQALNGRWPGVTVNVGVVRGGTRTNVVPASCTIEVDVRSPQEETLQAAEAEIERIAAGHTVEDVSVSVTRGGWHRPMEKKEGGAKLAALAIEVAGELGFELRDAATGGASDANTTSAAGVPTLDGLGPIGGDDHAPKEWLDLSSVVPRVSLLAGLLSRLRTL
jgi:glutamate carboxypeptidase